MADLRDVLLAMSRPAPAPAPPPQSSSAGLQPFPIAHADRLIWQDLDWLPRLQRLLYAFEAAIKFCASIALFGRARQAEPLAPEMLKTLARPSLGHWQQLLRTATRGLPDTPLFNHLAHFAHGGAGQKEALSLFDQAVQARNRFAHGASHQERDYRKAFEDLLPAWQRTLSGLAFLTEFPLGKVLRLHLGDDDRFVIAYRSYMGDNPVFRTEQLIRDRPLKDGQFGLFLPGSPGLLELTPLIQARECAKCGDEEVFFFNGLRGDKHDLLSYQKGHGFLIEEAADVFARRGLAW
jgi:hypothetical protein